MTCNRTFYSFATTFVIASHIILVITSIHTNSPSVNEIPHLVSGHIANKFHQYDIYSVNPPLSKQLLASPLFFYDTVNDWNAFNSNPGLRPEFNAAVIFTKLNQNQILAMIVSCRYIAMVFSLCGMAGCWMLARDIAGPKAALLSIILWGFSPNIIAHASVVTPDMASTAAGVWSFYFYRRYLKEPNWSRAGISGVFLGTTCLMKFTWVILFLIWPALWCIYKYLTSMKQSQQVSLIKDFCTYILHFIFMITISLHVINTGYLYTGSGKRLGEYEFVSQSLCGDVILSGTHITHNRFRGTFLENLIVPLPHDYVKGIDIQKYDFENYEPPPYLSGEFKEGGWWYYYLYGMAVKMPVSTLLMTLLSLFCFQALTKPQFSTVLLMLAVVITVLAFCSFNSNINHHLRYILPVWPFIFVCIGVSLSQGIKKWYWLKRPLLLLFCWNVISTAVIAPHFLSFFNLLAGGPQNGPIHLLDSNIDWGQDLNSLKKWIDAHPEAKDIQIAYYGFPPTYLYHLNENIPPTTKELKEGDRILTPGWYACSVNYVYGYSPTSKNESMFSYTYFKEIKPEGYAGYSIYIYYLSNENVRRVYKELDLPESNLK